jgi:hypothetical protein
MGSICLMIDRISVTAFRAEISAELNIQSTVHATTENAALPEFLR